MERDRETHRRPIRDVKDEVIIVCPEIARGAGGVADYTLRVVAEWRDQWSLRFLLPEGASATDARVETVARRRGALREKLPTSGGRVLLQYSAYGFDRLGYPRWLLRELVDWKQRSGGLLAIMFHEIWTFWPLLNKNYLVQELHRRDLAKLLAVADAVFTSTASQAGHLRALTAREIEVLPVGSNIEVSGEGPRAAGLAMLFGLQGSRIKALRGMHAELKSLAVAKKLTRLISVGGGEAASDEEERLLSELSFSDGFELRGALPESEISRLLMQASFGVSAQDELSLTKSGTFMAYAVHGLNILSQHGGATKPEPLCWLTQPGELLQGIDPNELAARSKSLRVWQERTSSWPRIAEQFARALQLPPSAARVGAKL